MFVDVTPSNRALCACPSCPTYDVCMTMEEESLYCGSGATMCEDVEQQECSCPGCAVFSANGLTGSYFCLAESAE